MSAAAPHEDWEAIMRRLLKMKDVDSARVAQEILDGIGPAVVPTATIIDVVLAYGGLAENQDPASESREFPHASDSLLGDLDSRQLATLLDGLVERARPLVETANFSAKMYTTNLVIRLAVRILEADSPIKVDRLWEWIGWLDERDSGLGTTRRLSRVFRERPALRAALIRHVLLTPCADNVWMAGDRLCELGFDLCPTVEDIAGVLKDLGARAGESPIDSDTWRDLLQFHRSADGLPAIVHDAAIEAANGDPELLSIVSEMSDVVVPEWEIQQEQHSARLRAEREEQHESYREALAAKAENIAAGDFRSSHIACQRLSRSRVRTP